MDAQQTVNAEKWRRGGVEGRLLARYRSGLLARIGPLEARTALDAGCGEGLLTEWLTVALPGTALSALDGDPEIVREAQERLPGVDVRAGDVYALPYEAGTFDLTLALEVLEHLDRAEQALRELARVSRGHVAVTVPHEPFFRSGNLVRGRYVSRLGSTPGHVNTWGRRGLVRLARDVGLRDAQWFGLGPWQGLIADVRA